jgi:hypothetical protein
MLRRLVAQRISTNKPDTACIDLNLASPKHGFSIGDPVLSACGCIQLQTLEPGNPISRRALASLLNPQEIFLNRQYTWVLRSIGKSPVNSKSCAIIAPSNGISGLNLTTLGAMIVRNCLVRQHWGNAS